MVQGVEPGAGGLYVCDFDRLLHVKDTDGDGRADIRRVLFSGFGIGDTHQLVNSISHGRTAAFGLRRGCTRCRAWSRRGASRGWTDPPWAVAVRGNFGLRDFLRRHGRRELLGRDV